MNYKIIFASLALAHFLKGLAYTIIPTGEPNAKEAIDRAIQKQPGAVGLLDGVIYKHGWYIPYIYGQFSFEVEGTPLIDPKL